MVDVNDTPIERITAPGIRTGRFGRESEHKREHNCEPKREREFDVIIYATERRLTHIEAQAAAVDEWTDHVLASGCDGRPGALADRQQRLRFSLIAQLYKILYIRPCPILNPSSFGAVLLMTCVLFRSLQKKSETTGKTDLDLATKRYRDLRKELGE